MHFLVLLVTGLNMSESQNSPPPQLGTNSSSVAIAILVPFFALIFTGFGFYLYKQRYLLQGCFFIKCFSLKFQRQKIMFLSRRYYITSVEAWLTCFFLHFWLWRCTETVEQLSVANRSAKR